MFSTPLICCSIGVTTVAATTSALAPGYWPETLMIGGAISGYCATGSRENDTPPRITNTIETTAAKIGRSMKKCEIRIQETFRRVGTQASSALSRLPPPCGEGGVGVGRFCTCVDDCALPLDPHPYPSPQGGGEIFHYPALASSGPLGFVGVSSCCGVTFWLGRARIRPLTMTRSVAVSPSLTTRNPPSICPSVTYFCRTTPVSSTTRTNLRTCSVPIAASGTSSAV